MFHFVADSKWLLYAANKCQCQCNLHSLHITDYLSYQSGISNGIKVETSALSLLHSAPWYWHSDCLQPKGHCDFSVSAVAETHWPLYSQLIHAKQAAAVGACVPPCNLIFDAVTCHLYHDGQPWCTASFCQHMADVVVPTPHGHPVYSTC